VTYLDDYFKSFFEATDGFIDWKKHKRIDSKLQDYISVSKTIINHGNEWIQERFASVKDIDIKLSLINIKVELTMEMVSMNTMSDLGNELLTIITDNSYPDIAFAAEAVFRSIDKMKYTLRNSHINKAITGLEKIALENEDKVIIALTDSDSDDGEDDIVFNFE